jgi:hypothetical protein
MNQTNKLKQAIIVIFIIILSVIVIEYVECLLRNNYHFTISKKINKGLTVVKLISVSVIIGLLVKYLTILNRKEPVPTQPEFITTLMFSVEKIENKYNDLTNYIGLPTYYEVDNANNLNSVTWMAPLDNYTTGYIDGDVNGLDYIRVNGIVGRKHHPIAADMYIIAGKYLQVPQRLLGPLKFASHTINIEQLSVPSELNNDFGKTDFHNKKGKSLVTGSCASVTISAITVYFAEKMIELYNKGVFNKLSEHQMNIYFRSKYDKAILGYLIEEKEPNISWFNPENYGEPKTIAKLQQCNTTLKSGIDANNTKNAS